jgi:hypothetical protein
MDAFKRKTQCSNLVKVHQRDVSQARAMMDLLKLYLTGFAVKV